MRVARPRLLLILAVMAVAAAAATSASASRPAQTGRVWFPGNVLPLAHATDLGAARPTQVMEIGIGLKDTDQAAEDALLAQIQNPASPQYHHFLTPSQFDARFGVPQAFMSRTLSWLRAGGARVVMSAGAHNFVSLDATVAQVDRLFGTRIDTYVAKGVHFLANATEPSVPSNLDVLDVMGLNTLEHPTTPLQGARRGDPGGSSDLGRSSAPAALASIPGETQLANALKGTPSAPSLQPAQGSPQVGNILTPQDLWSAYDMPSTDMGQGQTLAIMGAGYYASTLNDLPKFESWLKLPTVPIALTKIPSDGDFSDTGGAIEWELDTQSSTGIAPDISQIHLYFSEHLTDPDVEEDFVSWTDDPNGPAQANASFGECEETPENATLESTVPQQFNNNEDPFAFYGTGAPDNLEPVAEQTLEQANVEGRTLFASTGDTGSSCPVLVLGPEAGAGNGVANQGAPILNYPAVSRYVVAVGGTVLYGNGANPDQRAEEYPWPYTGGGQSFFIPEPSFQAGVANINRPCVSDVQGNPNSAGTICRGIPDVADESGDIATSSYDIYSDELGGQSSEGGTSLSSPLMVGMWTRMQAAAAHGTGFADPDIYKAAEKGATAATIPGTPTGENANDFNDYTVGSNGFYQAGTGWDYVSGWGTPILTPLMKDVDAGNTTPVNTAPVAGASTTPTASTTLVPVGSTNNGVAPSTGSTKGSTNAQACTAVSHLTYTLHGHTRKDTKAARVTGASVYVNRALVKRVAAAKGKTLRTVTIKRPLLSKFTVKIVTTLSTGGHVTSKRSYAGCKARTKVKHKAKKAKLTHKRKHTAKTKK